MDNDEARSLLDKIAAGDQSSMAAFYRLFARQVHAFALRHLGNPSEAEDVVVDCMHEVWTSARRFAGRSLVRTWVFGIARHRLLDRLRRRAAQPLQDIEALPVEPASEEESGYERLVRHQRAEHVAHCLERLSSEHRECLHLVFFADLSLAEVAEIQACPENTVKTRLFHAKRNMKRCLEHRLRDDDEH